MDLTKQKAQTNEGMLKEAERIFDEFANTLEQQVVSSPTENSLVDWESKFKEFTSLVRRMREAQKELDTCSIGDYGFRQHCASQLESEVDEYLKKMEEEK